MVLMAILVIMLFILLIDTKPAAAGYMAWQWNETDKMAGFLKKIALDADETVFGMLFPAFGYAEQNYVYVDDIKDPSYTEYLDKTDSPKESSAAMETQQEEPVYLEEPVSDIETAAENASENSMAVNTGSALFSRQELLDFANLVKNNYTVTSITELRQEDFDVAEALDIDMTMQQGNDQPQILIFHTHSQEGFRDSVEGDLSTGIVGVGEYLAELLRQRGYNVIHDTGVYDLVNGKLDRSKAYTYAEKGIEKILAQYPSIEVIIDLHRDGVDDDMHLVTDINGKQTAKIMFFNGISYTKVNGRIDYLPNNYIEENLAMSLQMKLLGDMYYPGLLRKNYINGYRYCLHYRGKSMLIEAGAQTNTLEEEMNAMEPLADMLHRLFTGEKAYK